MKHPDSHIELLIQQCKIGNQAAQMQIYNAYYKAMFNTSFRIVKDHFKAEDIMQESFLTAFTKLDTLNDQQLFGAWLKRIVVNNSIQSYQTNKKTNNVPLENVTYKMEAISEPENYSEEHNFKATQIIKAIQNLKENYRIGLNLLLIEGYDYEEIGEIMNLSYANCRTMISRAKESLRQQLATSGYLNNEAR